MSRTSIVIVAYNSAAVLPGCLASIPAGVPVVLVDNGCTDDSVAVAQAARPDIILVRTPTNLGFGRGANRGFEKVSSDFGLLLNADARLTPGVLTALEAAADRYPDAGMLAPEIFGDDGALQFGHATPFTPPRGRAMPMPAGDCCLDYVGGSAMFFRMEAFRAIGGFDPSIFLYGEDDDLCLRLTARRLALVHVAGCRIIHAGGRSSAPSPRLEWCKAFHQGWSRMHLQAKHRGLRSAWLLFLMRWPELRLKAASRRRDPRRVKWHGRAAGMWAWARGRKAAHMGLDPG
ncbi:glycosyltransferase family 2 protein [Rhodovarius crocodyli]|uniref:Glycosyltransferase family 2 protein n=1 Tax=Rhodovarius crocodyli TaxID=1979269 RepID=A0A437M1P3_9PROT|nr:glycosyltransferase family 2 protein [Rhodovarius crocodyli]RVT91607.1 glycosyltransferase family 2 protein [Rhodovarius crocodyli]